MSESSSNKYAIIVNAIAITTVLAVVSGYLPIQFGASSPSQGVLSAQQILPRK